LAQSPVAVFTVRARGVGHQVSRRRAVRRSIAWALADGYQPAMMVMAGPCAVAAIVIGLFVSDGGTAAPRLAPPPRCHGCALPVLHPRATTYPGGNMTTATSQRQPELTRQTVVVTGGGADLVAETARRARAEGVSIILTGRNPRRLERAADVPEPSGHVMVTAAGPAFR